jgi:pimeloyl-ACP methyl ester carboxylesterase
MQPNGPYGNNPKAGGTVKLKDAVIYYETYGSGLPLLLLHGGNQAIGAFFEQIGEFSKQYRVIAVDTRGQGRSQDFSTDALTYELFADDMKHLMDLLNVQNAHILGWSDGGITGLIMAIKYPRYVNKLAVMGANLFPTNEALKESVSDLLKELIEIVKDRTNARSKMQRRLFELALNEPHLTFDDLKKIKAATLVMAGEDDHILDSHTRNIASSITDSQLMIFKNATHYAPYYNAIEFNKAVLEFFDE